MIPSRRPKARSAWLRFLSRPRTSMGGSGGSAGGTKALTFSPAVVVSMKRPRRDLGALAPAMLTT